MATGLATRCTACGTTFRVVPDQLRVSGGWVRCGRCSEVFNALEELVDLETGERRGAPDAETGAGVFDAEPVTRRPDPEEELEVAQPAPRPSQHGGPYTHGAVSAPAPLPPASDVAQLRPPIAAPAPHPDIVAAPGDTPSFVRTAEEAARWRTPRMRALLLGLAVLNVLVLAGQFVYEYRDFVAARYPASRPVLEAACGPLGCRVEAARSIESLAVESSGLVRVERSSLYKLQVALRNRAGIDLAVPALDITLTDTQGRLISRKVFRLAELGVQQATIAAGRELGVQATLQAQGDAAAQPIAGYTIELFYP
jgi:predicted Zn finger-like uncharacterized protein